METGFQEFFFSLERPTGFLTDRGVSGIAERIYRCACGWDATKKSADPEYFAHVIVLHWFIQKHNYHAKCKYEALALL
jgi:hypothetical protein